MAANALLNILVQALMLQINEAGVALHDISVQSVPPDGISPHESVPSKQMDPVMVGPIVGWTIGVEVVGAMVGVRVGKGVGTLVGPRVGKGVGTFVGAFVSRLDGLAVGFLVTETEGASVGAIDGLLEGGSEGFALGVLVGTLVVSGVVGFCVLEG